MKELKNKVAVITGAGSGIGRALAIALAREGAKPAISDIDQGCLEETAKMIKEKGSQVYSHVLDVSKREDVYAYADRIVEETGGVDLVINNAGVTVIDSGEDLTYEDFEWIMGINFWGMVYGTKAFVPHLKKRKEGHIVNISSIFGVVGFPFQSAYNATKFGIRGFSEAMMMELAGTNIRISTVHPGGIKTDIARKCRFKKMEGVKDAAEIVQKFDRAAATSSDEAANIIIRGIRKNRERILVGKDAKLIDITQRLFPEMYKKILLTFFRKFM